MAEEVELAHLRREVKTALELAIIALAPAPLLDKLAAVAGLLDAMAELPPDSAPAIALAPKIVARAREGHPRVADLQSVLALSDNMGPLSLY